MSSVRRQRRTALTLGLAALAGLVLWTIGAPPALAREGTVRGAGAPSAVPGRYIVKLKDAAEPTSAVPAHARSLATAHGGDLRMAWDGLHTFSVSMSEDQAKQLAAEPDVEFVEQDQLLSAGVLQSSPGSVIPNAVQSPVTWGLDRIDQHALPLDNHYGYDDTAGQGVTAYILSSGIELNHPDFGGRASFGADFINDGQPHDIDCQGAGTAAAGIVAGAQYGVAKKASLVSVRVFGCNGIGSIEAILDGFQFVFNNAHRPAVVHFPLNDNCVDVTTQPPTIIPCDPSFRDAVIAAEESVIGKGVSVVAMAGDNGADACQRSSGAAPDAFYIGATTSGDARAATSNFGSCLTMYAPGEGITTDVPTGTLTGTSTALAAAFVTGTIALFAGRPDFAGKSPADIKRELVTNRATPGKLSGLDAASPNLLLYTGPSGFFTDGNPLGMARHDDGRLELLAVSNERPHSHILQTTQPSPGNSGWSAVTVSASEAWQSVVVQPNSQAAMQIVGIPVGGTIWARQETKANTSKYFNWVGMNAPASSPLVSVSMVHNASKRQQIFVTNRAGETWYRSETGPSTFQWGTWTRLSFTGKAQRVVAVLNGDSRIGLFLLDDAGQVWYTSQTTATATDSWNAIGKLDGFAMTSIAAARNPNGTLELLSVDSGGHAWRRAQTAAGAASFTQLAEMPARTLADITAQTNSDGRIQVVGVDNLGKIYQTSQGTPGGAYTAWTQILPTFTARP